MISKRAQRFLLLAAAGGNGIATAPLRREVPRAQVNQELLARVAAGISIVARGVKAPSGGARLLSDSEQLRLTDA